MYLIRATYWELERNPGQVLVRKKKRFIKNPNTCQYSPTDVCVVLRA